MMSSAVAVGSRTFSTGTSTGGTGRSRFTWLADVHPCCPASQATTTNVPTYEIAATTASRTHIAGLMPAQVRDLPGAPSGCLRGSETACCRAAGLPIAALQDRAVTLDGQLLDLDRRLDRLLRLPLGP